MLRLSIATALLLTLSAPASADWTQQQRTRFIADCTASCQETPDIGAAGKAACPKACNCLADRGEKMMTPADFEAADKAAAEDKMTPKMSELAKSYPACARQARGQ